MAQAFPTSGLDHILKNGLVGDSITVELLDNTTVVKTGTTTFQNPSNGEIDLNQITLEDIAQGVTVDEIKLKVGSVIIWSIDGLNYEFITPGSLTIDFTIVFQGTDFETAGKNRILNEGLLNKNMIIWAKNPSNTTLATGSFTYTTGGGALPPNTLDISSQVVLDFTAGEEVVSLELLEDLGGGPSNMYFELPRTDTFVNDGTLTISSFQISLTN